MAQRYESLDEVPPAIKEKLSKYFTSVGGDTFIIQGLEPEIVGAALARYSRANTGIQLTIVNEFMDENGEPSKEKGTALLERVINDFGDDSVAELAGVHVGFENVSQLETKEIEDRRIGASYIEQSTRYVKSDKKDKQGRWRYLRPKEIMLSGCASQYEAVNDRTFEVYSEGIRRLSEHFKNELPRETYQIEVKREEKILKVHENELISVDERKKFSMAYNFTIRCAALDVGRCVLPSSTLTHIGVFGNGRYFTNLLTYLKSQELSESRERAADLEKELAKVIPSFIKRNKVNTAWGEIDGRMRVLAEELFSHIVPTQDRVSLVSRGPHLDEIVASSLFTYTNISLQQILNELKEMPINKKEEILKVYAGNRAERRDRTGRGTEAGYPITFDLVGGFAEYRDLERHRMLTQQRQELTTQFGFELPEEMELVGLKGAVLDVVALMDDLNGALRREGLRTASQYATLFNHRIRFMMGMNAREMQHLGELRTGKNGHHSYRGMVMEMARQEIARDPWMGGLLQFVDYSDPGNKIARANEQARIARKNMRTNLDAGVDW